MRAARRIRSFMTLSVLHYSREIVKAVRGTKLALAGPRSWSTMDGTMRIKSAQKLGPQTQAIHAGERTRHGVNGPVATEIIRSSTFTFSSTEEMKLWAEGKNKAYIYTRYGN